jgi:hypothetical protein
MNTTTIQNTATGPVTGPAAWKPRDFGEDNSWLHVFTESQVSELRRAVQQWRATNMHFLDIKDPHALLPSFLPLAEQIKAELAGRGFVLLRGLRVWEMSDAEAACAYWAIGKLLGEGTTQNAAGDFVCPVTNAGVDFGYSGAASQRNVRGYMSNADLNYHCDPTDVVALLCLRKAKAGGESTIVSTTSIYNRILEQHPEHLPILLRGFPYDRKGEEFPHEEPVTPRIPVFVRHEDRVSCRYARSYILGGADKLGTPLSDAERAALDCFDSVARSEDLAMKMSFEPGDIQLLNNFTTVHGRTAYEDYPEPARRRYLYRLWLHLGETEPWSRENEVMQYAFARFGRLGWSQEELRRLEASQCSGQVISDSATRKSLL